MAHVLYEQKDDLVVLRVVGNLSIDEIHEAIKAHFPKVTKHLIWDFTNGHLYGVTPVNLKRFPDLVSKHLPSERTTGKTAYACPNDFDYGIFRMYTAIADIQNMPFEYGVYRSFEEAFGWVQTGLPD